MATLDKIPFRFKEWFDALVFVGIVLLVISTTVPIPNGFILNRSLFGVGGGVLLIGINEKAIYKRLYENSGEWQGTYLEKRRPKWFNWLSDGFGGLLIVSSVVDMTIHLAHF